ncbi:MAG: hypothetical protein K2K16_00420 [Ruminococcus sp.]|nr:hypothetical protein [Ruminococcus sp.]
MKFIKNIFSFVFSGKTSISIIVVFLIRIFFAELTLSFSLAFASPYRDISIMKISGTFEDGFAYCFFMMLFICALFRIPSIVRDFFHDIDEYRKENLN